MISSVMNLHLKRIYSRWWFTKSYLFVYDDIEIIIKVNKVNEIKLYHLCCSLICIYKDSYDVTSEEAEKLLWYITNF